MNRRTVWMLAILLVATLAASAAAIDGKWKMEFKMPEGKKGGGGIIVTTFDLKSDGDKLSGTVTTSMGGRERAAEIKDGKIDGEKFSFTTTQAMRGEEMKVKWEGTVSAEEIKGERSVEGRGSMPFNAKKQ